jgi:hypothetical protein
MTPPTTHLSPATDSKDLMDEMPNKEYTRMVVESSVRFKRVHISS